MASLRWYANRLAAMSPGEIVWRVRGKADELLERCRVQLNLVPAPRYKPGASMVPGFSLAADLPAWNHGDPFCQKWAQALKQQADALLEDRLSYFALTDHHLGTPVDWLLDHESGQRSDLAHTMQLDYRDFGSVGDCKLVWEPNRHHQLVVLARAYRVFANDIYAKKVVDLINHWIEANPYGYGMNWRSPLELGIRMINWVWALDLIAGSGALTESFMARVRETVYLHLRDVAGKFSQGTSANNHLIGEAAGVYVAAAYFPMFAESAKWQSDAAAILEREIVAQSFDDGCTREHAIGYQFFVLQFFVSSGRVSQQIGRPLSETFFARTELLVSFLVQLQEGGANIPMFGDADDGYVLDLGNRPRDVQALKVIIDRLQGRPPAVPVESSYWLFGLLPTPEASENPAGVSLATRGFPESGYYLLQHGEQGSEAAISVFVDCADLGYTSIAAHGHADALSVAVRIGGRDVLVDPGTFDYFTFPAYRNYFRSTAAHNTVMIDDVDQSLMEGAFMWTKHAVTTVEVFADDDETSELIASHSGYQRLPDPVQHRRRLVLRKAERVLEVHDEFICADTHIVDLRFHPGEHLSATLGDGIVTLQGDGQSVRLEFDTGLELRVLNGVESPAAGWLSRGYHHKVAIDTVSARMRIAPGATLLTRLRW